MELLTEITNLPSYVSAYGWIPFVVAILLTLLFSGMYVKYFWCQSERDKCSAGTATLGMTIALLAAFLLPVDVFLVSYMKNSDGSFKDWATNSTREVIENTVTYTYYSLYGIIFFYSFFILPLVYFAYEEKDEDRRSSGSVLLTAFMYTLVFLLVIGVLLLAGAFIPFRTAPQNSTQWDKIEFLMDEVTKNRGKDALSFVIHILTAYGMLNLIMYTAVGLSSFPLTLMKGFRPLSEEELTLSDNLASTQSKINALKSKQLHQSLSSREVSTLGQLEDEECLITRRSILLETEKKSVWNKFGPLIRMINSVFGAIGIGFSILLMVSLLINNIDKLLHSLGYKMGYVLKESLILNPMDYIMVQTQKVFPLDYIFYFSIIIFLVLCTVSGMRHLGVCCLCVPMYKLRPGRTPPQALIMLSFILMFTVLGFHILMYSLIPTYSTFGNQSYCKVNNSTCDLHACTLDAPTEDCVMTRSASFLLTFAYKAWIFSAAYFWLTWGFLVTFLLSMVINFFRSRRSFLEEAIDKDDFDDSYDDHMIRA